MRFEEKSRSRGLAACLSAAAVIAVTSGCVSAASAVETEEISDRRNRVIGPLEQYLVRIHGTEALASMQSGSEVLAWIDRIHLEAEEHIAACMREHGFDYVINPSPGRYAIDPWEIEFSVPYGTRLWAETYGF